ncbi:PAC2 family-domain-containing protein [Mucidula mucida]|nr:PAC2 family-domain-containing protein [Mucidula mucida]
MPFYYPIKQTAFNKPLILPIVSAANVSQLAADLLIESLSLQHIGTFDPGYFIPMIGGRENDEAGVSTACELFGSDEVNLIVMQQRSPTLKARKQEFVDALLGFIQKSGFTSVTFLSGVDLSNRTDAQMMTPFYQISPSTSPPFPGLADLPIPAYSSPVPQRIHDNGNPESPVPFIPGGGLTRRILSSLPPSWPIPTVSLLQFVLEGDNKADAQMLASVVAQVGNFHALIKQWKQPTSWSAGLFGTPHDQTLYG